MEPKIILAKDKISLKSIHVQEAKNGKSCSCICFECGKDLQAIQGHDRQWHFRHDVKSLCQGGFETALHQKAKEIIEEHDSIVLNAGNVFKYFSCILEKFTSTFKPDAQLFSATETLLIEVKVTHGISDLKLLKIKKYNHKVIEIDLSNVSREISYDELKYLVLNESINKHLIYDPMEIYNPIEDYKPIEKSAIPGPNWLQIGFWLALIFLILNTFFTKRKYSVR